MKVPVLFIIFCRPEISKETFKSIRSYQPEDLYIAADGPRSTKKNEKELCEETREGILQMIDWPCRVHKLFREHNVGCGLGVASAISWMFETEKYGVIIEDDCVPSQDFFLLCETLLPLYNNEDAVKQINGFNPTAQKYETNEYCFGRSTRIWGWATWKRAWKNHDMMMKYWPEYRDSNRMKKQYPLIHRWILRRTWDKYFKELQSDKKPRAWDYQWAVYVNSVNGLCVVPKANLVLNTGCGTENATNCDNEMYKGLIYGKLKFPLNTEVPLCFDDIQNRIDSRFFVNSLLKRKILNALKIVWRK